MKIRTKLMLIFAVFTSLILAVVGVNYITYQSLDSDTNFVNYAGRLRAGSYRMAHLSAYIIMNPSQNSDAKNELEDRVQSFDITLTGLLNGDEQLGLKGISDEEIKASLLDIESKWQTKFKSAYTKIKETEDIESLSYINDNVSDYVTQIDSMVSDYSSMSQGKVTRAKIYSTIFFAISLLLAIFSVTIIRKGIINPINLITRQLKEISQGNGDLTKTIEFKSNDEIGMLTNYFNQFIGGIKDIVIMISQSSNTLSDAMDSISGTSGELAKSTEMIASSVMGVSEGSMDQSNMVRKLTDLVDQMSLDINRVIEKAKQLLLQSEESKDAAVDGNTTIEKQVQELDIVVKSAIEVSDTVNELESYSKDIKNIMDIIDSISKQTNLLALNASIEAARAGEAGRGFAVVAEEIRKLADQTDNSTVQIVEITNNIIHQTVKVKSHMDDMVTKISLQEKSMNEVQLKLDKIVEKSNATYTEVKDIEGINRTINDNFNIINESAGRISEVVEKNSQNTQDVAAAVEEQTASFQEVSANMASLNELSKQLSEIVSRFKVENS